MARRARERARALDPEAIATVGLGATASLASDRPKKGDHRCHIAVATGDGIEVTSIVLDKGRRDRAAEEDVVARAIVIVLARACGVETPATGACSGSGDRLVEGHRPAPDPLAPLLAGSIDRLTVIPRRSARARRASPSRGPGRLVQSAARRPPRHGPRRVAHPRDSGGLRAVGHQRRQAGPQRGRGDPPAAAVRVATRRRADPRADVSREGPALPRNDLRGRHRHRRAHRPAALLRQERGGDARGARRDRQPAAAASWWPGAWTARGDSPPSPRRPSRPSTAHSSRRFPRRSSATISRPPICVAVDPGAEVASPTPARAGRPQVTRYRRARSAARHRYQLAPSPPFTATTCAS